MLPTDPLLLTEARERLVRLARALTADALAADEAAQDTLVLAWQRRTEPRASWPALLAGMLRNVLRGHRRGERRRMRREQRSARPEAQRSAAELSERLETHARLFEAVRSLPEPVRRTIVLRYLEGRSPRHIAAADGVSAACVKSRLRRGLVLLRARLDARGGGRDAWLGALLPFAAPGRWHAGWIGIPGGAMAKLGTARTLGITLVLLLSGMAAWQLQAPDERVGRLEDEASLHAPPPTAPPRASTSPTAARALRGHDHAVVTPPAPPDLLPPPLEASEVLARADGPEAHDVSVPPALRRSTFDFGPPPASQGPGRIAPGGAPAPAPDIGPSGYWTKFPRPQPHGAASLEVRVRLPDGTPVAGAEVMLAAPDVLGGAPLSFGDLLKAGTTDATGTLRRDGLPEGRGTLLVHLMGITNREAGLLPLHGVAVRLVAGPRRLAEITLGSDAARLGRVRGSVVDEQGRPLARARVGSGRWFQTTCDGAGRFEAPFVEPGQVAFRASATGYATATAQVEVSPGTGATVELRLALAESGTVEVAGEVVGPDGERIPDATVYALDRQRGTLRSTRTDADGRFRLEGLPDRLRTDPWRLQADRIPQHGAALLEITQGLPRGDVRLVLPRRLVQVEVAVRDAASGQPLRRARARLLKIGDTQRAEAPLGFDDSRGVYGGTAAPGPQELVIETHTGTTVRMAVDPVPGTEGVWRTEVRVAGALPEPSDVRLEVFVTDAATGTPLPNATLEVLVRGDPVSRLTAARRDGHYVLPAPSLGCTLRVVAEGYEPHERAVALEASQAEATERVALRAR